MISRGTLALVVFLITANTFAGTLSFRQWKHRRIAEKNSIVTQIKRDKSLNVEIRQNKLIQAKLNLQTEKDLSPDDYFHLYLVEQFKKDPKSARATAKTLSKDELADIIISYISATNQFYKIEANSNHLQTSR